MTFTPDYDDLDYGDEVRGEALQTVGLPHNTNEDGSGGPDEGQPVAWDESAGSDGAIVAADASAGLEAIGVLYTYNYYGDSSRDGPYIRTDRNATVAVGGKVKARMDSSGIEPGPVTADATSGSAGTFNASDADDSSNFAALSTSQQQDLDDGTTAYYSEVLLR